MGLEPTPELLATARRVATREWTVDHDQPAFPSGDEHLDQLVNAGYAHLYLPPTRLCLDYWTLTQSGREWLEKHDTKD